MPTQADPSRHSSFVGVENNARHNSYTGSQENARHSSYMGSQDNERHSYVPVSQEIRYHHKYLEQVHYILQPFVSHIQDVALDGNCGFRSTAVALVCPEDDWIHIQNELIQEMMSNWNVYIHVFDDVRCNRVFNSLHWSSYRMAPRERWMDMPSTAFMIANRYGVIVHSLSTDERNNSIVFPLLHRSQEILNHAAITILNVDDCHFVVVKFEGIPDANN
ncbi:uncharacterized protein LOC143635116 [Bidens hawaiensis]|uniref:uncharacterized protein LOC143635116 n=1 Tax=Bidens hawaiensis TaxID=980011 RepID=UPI00404A7A81